MEGSLWSRDSVFRLAQGSALGALALGLKAPMARADEYEDDEGVGTRPKTVEEYIDQIDKLNLRVADFPKGMEWIQSPPLSFSKELRGKVRLIHSLLGLLCAYRLLRPHHILYTPWFEVRLHYTLIIGSRAPREAQYGD